MSIVRWASILIFKWWSILSLTTINLNSSGGKIWIINPFRNSLDSFVKYLLASIPSIPTSIPTCRNAHGALGGNLNLISTSDQNQRSEKILILNPFRNSLDLFVHYFLASIQSIPTYILMCRMCCAVPLSWILISTGEQESTAERRFGS